MPTIKMKKSTPDQKELKTSFLHTRITLRRKAKLQKKAKSQKKTVSDIINEWIDSF